MAASVRPTLPLAATARVDHLIRPAASSTSRSAAMGGCHSSCSTPASDLEYYDAWRHYTPHVHKANGQGVALRSRSPRRRQLGDGSKLWVCEGGCCSVRWKLEYAELATVVEYARRAPFGVEQNEAQSCECVLCRGLPAQSTGRRMRRCHRAESRTSVAGDGERSAKTSVASGESVTDEDDGQSV